MTKLIKIERRKKLSKKEFIENYLKTNKPVIVTDSMDDWKASYLWTPEYFNQEFGKEKVQIYDDLFNLINITNLNNYLKKYFNRASMNNSEKVPYVRWYTKLKENNFAWSDHIFDKIKYHWTIPYFLPETNYLLPYCVFPNTIYPNIQAFPAKGLFISGKKAKTRLHFDPWCSDAILCQIYGTKKVFLFHPAKKQYLSHNNECIDLNNPDKEKFSNYLQVQPDYIDILRSGEIIFLPQEWLHQVNTVSDSISLTWNFVHHSTLVIFF